MNITQATQATVAATRKVVRKTKQPKTAVRVSALVMGALTFISQLSYESGSPIALIIPYEYKAEVTAAAGLATLILGFMGEYMPNRPTEPKPSEELPTQ
jgi:hypothetical protein